MFGSKKTGSITDLARLKNRVDKLEEGEKRRASPAYALLNDIYEILRKRCSPGWLSMWTHEECLDSIATKIENYYAEHGEDE